MQHTAPQRKTSTKRKAIKTAFLNLRVEPAIRAGLEAIAAREDRPLTYIAVRAMRKEIQVAGDRLQGTGH